MTKKAAVLAYDAEHPDAMPRDVVAGLTRQGIEITPRHVSIIKTNAAKTASRPKQKPGPKPEVTFAFANGISPELVRELYAIGVANPSLQQPINTLFHAFSEVIGSDTLKSCCKTSL